MTRNILACAGALLLVPALTLGAAQAPKPAQKPKTAAKPAAAATHTTSGIVQSVTDTSLVVAKNAKATKSETFVINATTVKKGEISVGARVGVRYVTEGGQNIATAVTANKGKQFSLE